MAEEKPALERRLADHHINRYLRPYRRAEACFLVVVLPTGISSLVWKDAALAWSSQGDKTRWRYKDPAIVASDKALTDLNVARDRIVVLIEREDRDEYLEHTTVAAADAVVDITEIDPKLIQLAFREVTGGDISHADATVLAALPASRRRLISFAGRPVSEVIGRLAVAQEKEDLAKATQKVALEKKAAAPRLEDLHGYGEAKEWGLELARDIADYRNGLIEWSDVDGGLLLSGPPGVGKTRFAAALAETCGIPLVVASFAKWQAKGHQGDALKAMQLTFDAARRCAPCIVFLDEVDNFADRDSDTHTSDYMRGIVNALLEHLDGAVGRDGVVVLGACNNAHIVDPALRRSGRLDRHVEIGLPDAGARMHILRRYLGVDLDMRPFLRRTEGMTGADLERVARDARRLARREGIELEDRHVIAALPTRIRRTPDNLRLLARHEIGHAVVGHILGVGSLLVVHVTQEFDPNASAAPTIAGAAAFRFPDGQQRNSVSFTNSICAKLAGLAAEQLYYGTHGEGCISDLEDATALATYMLASVGMGDTLSSAGHRDQKALEQARLVDQKLAKTVEEMLQTQAVRAREILEQHRDAVDELVELLILRGRLKGPEIIETIRSYEMGPTLTKAV
ncbi:SpoVK/Ycf46/Vps4 family AAA+-type ATPase [Sinorhizobium kostiense]|uniref:SpoVK/Ycf46/Vps4 family AAA+-type ATPase n=1 Tax=Sinorhizobium kostiense TaxID=76747 RepID=A0ABS4QX55_9HYPH|nr:AAA family ATPase [Sinorhizobium kostiense]MBP2235233.1 SpoVK/Ycf46/Vps4 family AAA+-type ATPase [Sinorhizobium kostiense]